MRKLPASPKVAVVGATGAVGRVMLDLLFRREFPASGVRAFATQRSAGRTVDFGGESLVVEAIDRGVFEGIDLVFIDTPDDIALKLAPQARDAGAIVIDKSAAWRMDEGVPLVVPEINADALEDHEGLIASPNCTTTVVVLPLYPLHLRFGLERAVVASYQSASGAGRGGTEELMNQAAKLVDQEPALAVGEVWGFIPEPSAFVAPVAFNVVPLVGSESDLGYTGEEWKMVHESRKIMGLPDVPISATCVRVPTVVGHGAAVHCRFSRETDADEAISVLANAEGVEPVDLPTALLAAGKDPCYVGRVRKDPFDDFSLWFFSSCDNLRKGAALNAVQIAERLLPLRIEPR